MPLTPNFTAAQVLGEESEILFTDTSTGSDVDVVTRRIYLATSLNTFLVESGTATDYEVWSGFPGTTTITIDVLEEDAALTVTVEWLNVGGDVLYSKSVLYGFTGYNEEFDYQLTQMMTANPMLINDNNFYENKSRLRTEIDSGNQAIELAEDIFAAQSCYDRATALRTSSQYYYNANS